jgi:FHA domain
MEDQSLVSVLKTSDGRQVSISEVLANRPAFIIGSDGRTDLQLIGEGVAPSHALISRSGADYTIAPRFPTTAVYLNNKPIKLPARLSVGDTVQIGSVQISFAQMEGRSAPVLHVQVILPAVLPPGHAKAIAPVALSPAQLTRSPVASGKEIYYPRREQGGGSSAGALLSGLAVLLIVGGVIGYSLFSGGATSVAAGDLTAQFAFKDGNVTVVMFDADW